MLNGRALTANSDDPNDLEPLTPAHLLMQRKIICLPPGVFEKTDIYRKKWGQVQFLANLFWERWLKEYIPTLQQRDKWRRVLPNIKPDALVLLVNDNSPRGQALESQQSVGDVPGSRWSSTDCEGQDQGRCLCSSYTEDVLA